MCSTRSFEGSAMSKGGSEEQRITVSPRNPMADKTPEKASILGESENQLCDFGRSAKYSG
jgi:hypothetical protein